MRDVVDVVLARSWRRESPWHGEEHWRCVAATGLELARVTAGADGTVAFLFGLLHDTRRENESVDPEHGPRAAAFARELAAEGVLSIAPAGLEQLARAIELHSNGLVDDDPTIAVCWDADRLHLPRVSIEPDPARFSGPLAGLQEWRERAAGVRLEPPSWESLLGLVTPAVAGGPIPQSYRVTDRLFAGEYPGALGEAELRERLAAFEDVDLFVDLTDDGLPPYEGLLRPGARRLSFPVADFTVPDEGTVVEVLDAIDSELAAGRTVYLHCWGGRGRTGTLVGCWLVRHGASGDDALERVSMLHRPTPAGALGRRSPETDEQCELVRRWRPGA